MHCIGMVWSNHCYLLLEGPISSIFDYLTFFLMLFVIVPMFAFLPQLQKEHLFQTAWFVESLCTQTLVVFIIRTRTSPFYKSKPGKYLVFSCLLVVAIALILPYSALGKIFNFYPPPLAFYAALGLMIVAYLFLAEVVKRWFYKRFAFRIEQVLVPKRKGFYLSKNARLVQDIAAVVCLHEENEISLDSLLDDLSRSLNYPIDSDRVYQNLLHLHRGGLIDVDWHKRVIKRTGPIKEYISKQVVASRMWPLISDDWIRISKSIQDKYGKVNPDFQDLLPPKQV